MPKLQCPSIFVKGDFVKCQLVLEPFEFRFEFWNFDQSQHKQFKFKILEPIKFCFPIFWKPLKFSFYFVEKVSELIFQLFVFKPSKASKLFSAKSIGSWKFLFSEISETHIAFTTDNLDEFHTVLEPFGFFEL